MPHVDERSPIRKMMMISTPHRMYGKLPQTNHRLTSWDWSNFNVR